MNFEHYNAVLITISPFINCSNFVYFYATVGLVWAGLFVPWSLGSEGTGSALLSFGNSAFKIRVIGSLVIIFLIASEGCSCIRNIANKWIEITCFSTTNGLYWHETPYHFHLATIVIYLPESWLWNNLTWDQSCVNLKISKKFHSRRRKK